MKEKNDFLRQLLNKYAKSGFFSVFLSNAASKVLSFIGGMIVVRVLSKDAYGSYAYVMNCYGMLMLLNDLGCAVATFQYCSENYQQPERFHGFFSYGYRRGMAFGVVTGLLLFLCPYFYPFKSADAAALTRLLCLMPLLTITNQFLSMSCRTQLQNTRYAWINFFDTFIHYAAILPLAYLFGVKGAVLSNYLIASLTLVFSALLARDNLYLFRGGAVIPANERKGFLKLAFASQLNNGIDQALVLLDIFVIGLIIGENVTISSYKVASTLPAALAFVPNAIMVYAIPYFARRNTDLAWVRAAYRKLILFGGLLHAAIAVGMILLGPWLLPLLFGAQYADTVACFIVLMIGYFFSATFRIPSASIIYTQHKVKINILITILTGVANIFLDVFFVLNMGSIGAAVATTLAHIIASALSFGYMCRHLKSAGAAA